MRRALPILLTLSLGCLPRLDITVPGQTGDGGATDGGTTDGGADGGSDTGLPSGPSISTIDPTDGPTNGGQVVAILGGPFDDSVQVTFDKRGATLATLSEDRVTVVAPPTSAGEGSVDVTVRTDAGTATVEDGYSYWENAQEDTVLVGMWQQLVLAGSADTVAFHDSWVRFVEPDVVQPIDRYGIAMGTCGLPANGLTSRQGPDSVQFGTADAPLDLPWSGKRVEYAWTGDTPPDLVAEQYLSFHADASGVSPELQLDEFVRTETPIGPTSPDLTLDSPELPTDEATITWTAGDHPYVLLTGITDAEALFLCVVEDSGSFTIPGDDFDGLVYEPGSEGRETASMWLGFATVSSGEVELEYNAGTAVFDAAIGLAGQVLVSRSTGSGVTE